jgi:hypothetical protein
MSFKNAILKSKKYYKPSIVIVSVEKPETLTTFGQLFTQKYKIHDNSNLQPAGGGQINLAKCG